MKKRVVGLGILLIMGVAVIATIAYFVTKSARQVDLQMALGGHAISVVDVLIKEARTSSQVDGTNTLEVLAQVKETVVGVKIEGEIRGKYIELFADIPEHPKPSLHYRHYSGSGQELRTQANDRVLLLISGKVKGAGIQPYFICRVEPLERKSELLKWVAETF